jgi:thiamine biosynthesis lipoprotein
MNFSESTINNNGLIRRMRPLLGTFVEVGAKGEGADLAIEAAFQSLELSQHLWSFQNPESELSRINASSMQPTHVHPLTCRLMTIAKMLMIASHGAFDFTLGGEMLRQGKLPDHGVKNVIPSSNHHAISIGKNTIQLHQPILLCLDGIAKGFAIDCAIHAMRMAGIHTGWINAGGDVRAFGDIVLPMQRRELNGEFSMLGGLRNAAMASSWVATNAVQEDGGIEDALSFPAHIIASKKGNATHTGVWTVIARCAWRADGLTKVAAVTPDGERKKVISQLGGQLVEHKV